jgi:hypothetical protein
MGVVDEAETVSAQSAAPVCNPANPVFKMAGSSLFEGKCEAGRSGAGGGEGGNHGSLNADSPHRAQHFFDPLVTADDADQGIRPLDYMGREILSYLSSLLAAGGMMPPNQWQELGKDHLNETEPDQKQIVCLCGCRGEIVSGGTEWDYLSLNDEFDQHSARHTPFMPYCAHG